MIARKLLLLSKIIFIADFGKLFLLNNDIYLSIIIIMNICKFDFNINASINI